MSNLEMLAFSPHVVLLLFLLSFLFHGSIMAAIKMCIDEPNFVLKKSYVLYGI